MMENQLEARYSLTDNLRLATFLDTGFVTSESLSFKDAGYFTRNLLAAVGTGIRYLTPVGPIRLDIGYRIRGLQFPEGDPFELEPERLLGLPVAVAIGIGEAF